MRYKTIIIDDEQPICDEIEYLLQNNIEFEICAKFCNSLEALDYLVKHRPDVIFLDIRMPGLTGLEFAKKLNTLKPPPLVVFITAFQEYALEAFETSAVGYITKPVDEDKLQKVLSKICNLLPNTASLAGMPVSRICVVANGKIIPLDKNDIVFVYVNEKDVFVRTASAEFTCPLTMKEIDSILSAPNFLRVHRQYIVNLNEIAEIMPWFHYSFLLRMNDFESREIPVSRNKIKQLKQAVGLMRY